MLSERLLGDSTREGWSARSAGRVRVRRDNPGRMLEDRPRHRGGRLNDEAVRVGEEVELGGQEEDDVVVVVVVPESGERGIDRAPVGERQQDEQQGRQGRGEELHARSTTLTLR